MRASVAVVLCLCVLAMAAEDKSDRKSRQILHPLVHSSSFRPQPYHFPAVAYVQPAVHSVALPQHFPAFQLSGPQVFSGHHYPAHYHLPQYHYLPQTHHYPQPVPQIAFPFAGRYQSQPSPVNSERFGQSPRPFQQSDESSFQPSNSPSQNLQSSGPQNPNFRQSQTSSTQTGLSAFGSSPRFQDQPQPNMPFPSDTANSQPSSQPQQQTRAFFSGSFDQQSSSPAQASQQGAPTPILSQSGQTRNDGSYNFGFQSTNGIQRTETSEMRPGLYRYEERSYSN